jgi:hypothetical protein
MMMSDMWAGVAVIVIGEVSTEGGRSLLKGDCNTTEARPRHLHFSASHANMNKEKYSHKRRRTNWTQ